MMPQIRSQPTRDGNNSHVFNGTMNQTDVLGIHPCENGAMNQNLHNNKHIILTC